MSEHTGKPRGMMKIASNVELPIDAVTQTMAFIGRKGAGKTYAAIKMAELMLENSAQVIALDPVGNWYGLRTLSDGKSTGFNIPVFGGSHGDIPLLPTSGAMIADLIIDKQIDAILDVSGLRKNQRKQFVTDFAEQLFHRKKTNRSPMHIFFEEAQVFAPQRISKGEERMLGAVEDIVRLGRNYGIGNSLISQRPQSVNKEVLNQAEALFLLQVVGPHERKAIESWVVEKGIDVRDMVNELPSLKVGNAFLWSPQWLGILKKIKIAKKKTFDASSTPKHGDKQVSPVPLLPCDIDDIKLAMTALVEQAEENDPKALKKKIASLEREKLALERRLKKAEVKSARTPVKPVSDSVVNQDQTKELEDMHKAITKIIKAVQPLSSHVKITFSGSKNTPIKPGNAAQINNNGDVKFRSGAIRILKELASRYPAGYTKPQVGVLTKFKHTGGTFGAYMGELKRAEYIELRNGLIYATEQGIEYLGDDVPSSPTNHKEAMTQWRSSLRAGAYRMLEAIVNSGETGIDRDQIANAVGMTMTGGTFGAYLGDLRRNGLIVENHGIVKADEILFP